MTDEQFDKLCGKLDKMTDSFVELKKLLVAGLLTNAGLNKAALGRFENPMTNEELDKAFNDGNIIFSNYYNSIQETKKS